MLTEVHFGNQVRNYISENATISCCGATEHSRLPAVLGRKYCMDLRLQHHSYEIEI